MILEGAKMEQILLSSNDVELGKRAGGGGSDDQDGKDMREIICMLLYATT